MSDPTKILRGCEWCGAVFEVDLKEASNGMASVVCSICSQALQEGDVMKLRDRKGRGKTNIAIFGAGDGNTFNFKTSPDDDWRVRWHEENPMH